MFYYINCQPFLFASIISGNELGGKHRKHSKENI